ncbi:MULTISPECIES: glycosyltransferase family 2 protein [Winogradskyella]|uniref:Glycosyltransferase, GT2 family n=1 Tax=Winogradskyella thalassocola TaxID=262004 RepID=A0A1G8FYC0_9FLAO|nr:MULTISPECIES: glycosyltransferase family 2 protein [Winogradskyella]SDH86986.1 Glycosyltransferase, GT2 family [Winogradskyella thalassocola]
MVNSIYIIIVTYNGMPWLKMCLDSCVNYAVVVVDNASTDDTVSFIETNYPDVTLFKQDQNLGFGQANNLGIRCALDQGAEHVFLLNQDAYIVNKALDDLVAFQKKKPEYGVLSPIHIAGNQKKLDKNFSNFMLKEYTDQFYSDFVLGNTLAEAYDVPFVNAAAWLLSRECLETVGGFDPLFFHYGEDDNYCQRVLYHGLKIGVLPKSYVIHDREDRKQIKPLEFSDAYYNNRAKFYKKKYANVNADMQIEPRENRLRKTILKLQLQLKFSKANGFKKELLLLKAMKPLIIKSRTNNVLPGSHYI